MRKLKYMILALLLTFMTGCWDRVEIEERLYVTGVAIDAYPPIPQEGEIPGKQEASPQEEEVLENMELHTGEPMYAMTIHIPILKHAAGNASGGEGESNSGGSKSWEITQIGNSFMEMNHEFSTRLSLVPYYGHLQVIVISERVARKGISNVLDFFDRDPEMRKRIGVFISPSEAKKVFEVVPRIEDYASSYLSAIPKNVRQNARLVHKTDLGEVVASIRLGLPFVLPDAEVTKDEIKVSKAAVFKDGRMVGWTGSLDTEIIKLVRDLYKGGIFTAPDPDNKESIVTLEVERAGTDIEPVIQGKMVSFKVHSKIKGKLAERLGSYSNETIHADYLKKMSDVFARRIEDQCRVAIKNIQKEFGADVFHFQEILKAKKPGYWEMVKDRWDEIFPQVEVSVTVDVTMMNSGLSQ